MITVLIVDADMRFRQTTRVLLDQAGNAARDLNELARQLAETVVLYQS